LTIRQRLDVAGWYLQLGLLPAVDEPHLALAPGMMLVRVTERSDVPFLGELEIVDQQDTLSIENGLLWATHDQRAVEAALGLLGLVDVRVVPERSGIGNHEAVLERLAWLDGPLHGLRAVHVRRDTEPVPVNRRRLGEFVRELDDERVADPGLDQRSRHLVIECVPRHASAGREVPRVLAREQSHSSYSSCRRTQNWPRPFSSRPFGTRSR
jgi:hypothetical protein